MTLSITITILYSLAIGFSIAFFIIPFIIKVARVKKLFDIPNERSATRQVVPTLGGVAILLGFFISVLISSGKYNIDDLKYLFAATFVMFGVGLKDDLLGTSAMRKLVIELSVALGLVILGNLRITNLHGLLGIEQMGYFSEIILSVIAFVGIVNAFNLIDGIDGLASGTGILISLTYGIWFLNAGDYLYMIACFSLTGSLFAFFLYNVFGNTNKIFMGDTGSLLVGTILAVFTIHFNGFIPVSDGMEEGLPAISLAIMIVPVIDTLRIFVIRILKKKSPFSPDMNHIHHQLLRLGYSHLKSSLIIISINAIFILLALSFIHTLGNNLVFLITLGLGFFIANIPLEIVKLRERNRSRLRKTGNKTQLLICKENLS